MSVTRSQKIPCRIVACRKDKKDIYQRIFTSMNELRTASNKVINEVYLVMTKRQEISIPLLSFCYSSFSGTKGVPCLYEFKNGSEVSGGVKSAIASLIYQRLRSDWRDILAGDKSLCTFKKMPIPFRASEVKFIGDYRVRLTFWAGRKRNSLAIDLYPRGAGQKAVFEYCKDGTYKQGGGRLNYDRMHKQWSFSLSYTMSASEDKVDQDNVLGVDINMVNMAVVEAWNGKAWVRGSFLKLDLPVPFWRLFDRYLKEKNTRLNSNKDILGLRKGRGRKRKLRVVQNYKDKFKRTMEDACRNMACALVRHAKKFGCTKIAIEDFSDYAELLESEAMQFEKNRQRAYWRRKFLSFNRYRMHQCIKNSAEVEGIDVIIVNRAGTTRNCHVCGEKATHDKKKRRIICSGCKTNMDQDRNAARNIALRYEDKKKKR